MEMLQHKLIMRGKVFLVADDTSMNPRLLELGQVLKYTWPLLLAALGSIVVGLTDSLLVAHYSTDALAGVTLGAAIYELPINALLGALMAYRIISPRIYEEFSQKREIIGLRMMLSRLLPLSIVLMCVIGGGVLCTQYLMNVTRFSEAFSYLAARSPSLVLEIANSAMVILLVVWGKTRTPLVVFLMSAPSNLLFDLFLVYGFGPFSGLGALGAGIGSAMSAAVPLPFLMVTLRKMLLDSHVGRLRVEESIEIKEKYQDWRRIAWPSVCSAAVDYGGNIVFVSILSTSGVSALAGMRFGIQAHLLAFIFVSSVSSAALYILGKVYGKNPQRIKEGAAEIRQTFLVVGVFAGVIILILSHAISPLISSDTIVQESFRVAAYVVAGLCPIMGFTYGNVTLLRLFGLTHREFMGNALGVWAAQIPIAFLLTLTNNHIFPFAGLPAYWIFRGVISCRQANRDILNA